MSLISNEQKGRLRTKALEMEAEKRLNLVDISCVMFGTKARARGEPWKDLISFDSRYSAEHKTIDLGHLTAPRSTSCRDGGVPYIAMGVT